MRVRLLCVMILLALLVTGCRRTETGDPLGPMAAATGTPSASLGGVPGAAGIYLAATGGRYP